LHVPRQSGIQVEQQCQPFAPAIHHEIAETGNRTPYRRDGYKKFNQPGDDYRYGTDNGD